MGLNGSFIAFKEAIAQIDLDPQFPSLSGVSTRWPSPPSQAGRENFTSVQCRHTNHGGGGGAMESLSLRKWGQIKLWSAF